MLILLARGVRAALNAATSYTATHYVAPFASAAGSPTSDYDAQDAAAFTAASNPATPCTLMCAMVNAAAGNKVRCAAGVYTGEIAGNGGHEPAFYPRNSGTAGNPIIFFAATPAATNRSSPGSWSELRIDSPPTVNGTGNAVIGSTAAFGGDYIVFDGFAAIGDYAPPYPSRGAFSNGADYVEFRRMYYDYGTLVDATADDNYSALFWQGGTGGKVLDSYFTGNYGYTKSGTLAPKNFACIVTYNVAAFTIKNNYFYDFHSGVFIKVGTNYGEISYNKFERASFGAVTLYTVATGQIVHMHNNLMIDAGFLTDFVDPTPAHPHGIRVNNNTAVGGALEVGGISQSAMMATEGDHTTITDDSEFYNNIAIINTVAVSDIWSIESASTATGMARYTILNYNGYYDTAHAAEFSENDGTSSTDFAGWKTRIASLPAAAREANSFVGTITLDGNYKLSDNGQTALTASDVSGPIGCYVTGTEEIGIRANPSY